MRRRDRTSSLSILVEETKARQENVIWPRPLQNSRKVDEILFKGSTSLTPVQRVGVWIFGIVYICAGLSSFGVAQDTHGGRWFFRILGTVILVVGIWIVRNGCRRRRGPES
jgi:hypothetical protein